MSEDIKDLVNKGEKCIRDGELDKGIQLLHEALTLYEADPIDDPDQSILSVIYSQLGNAYYMRKDFAKACEYHGKDCEISSRGSSTQKAKALSNHSMALAMSGKFEEALNVARQVICEAHNMESNEAQSFNCRGYYNLGMAFLQSYYFNKNGNEFDPTRFDYLDEAKSAFTKCLEFSINKSDENSPEADPVNNLFYNLAVGNLGLVYYFSYEYHDAMTFYEKRLRTAKKSNDFAAQLRTLINLGNTCLQLGKLTDAANYYYEALKLLQSQPKHDAAAEARVYFNVANTEFVLKNYTRATENFIEACRLAKEINDTSTISESSYQIAVLLERMQQVPEALYFLIQRYNIEEDKAFSASHQLYDPENQPDDNHKIFRQLRRDLLDTGNSAMDSAKADIERFVRKYPEKCVTTKGRVNARQIRSINDLHLSNDLTNPPTLTTSLSVDNQPINDENKPVQNTDSNSSFDMMNSSLESFILSVAGSAHSSTPNRSSTSHRSQRYEVSSTNDEEEDFSENDVGFSRASNYTPAKLATTTTSSISNVHESISTLPFDEIKLMGQSSNEPINEPCSTKKPDQEEDFLDILERVSGRRINDQRGELPEDSFGETDDFVENRPSDALVSSNKKKRNSVFNSGYKHLRRDVQTLTHAIRSGRKSIGGSLHRQFSSSSKLSNDKSSDQH